MTSTEHVTLAGGENVVVHAGLFCSAAVDGIEAPDIIKGGVLVSELFEFGEAARWDDEGRISSHGPPPRVKKSL